jgi:Ca-activated chloride channel family protein
MKRFLYKGILRISFAAALLATGMMIMEYYVIITADHAYKQGQYNDALKKYRALSYLHPDSTLPAFGLGTALYKEGEYEKAIQYFKKSAIIDDKRMQQKAMFNLGNTFYHLGYNKMDSNETIRFYQKSIDHYNQAIALNRENKDAMHNKAVVEQAVRVLMAGESDTGQKNAGDDRYRKDLKQPQTSDRQQAALDQPGREAQSGTKGKTADDNKEKGAKKDQAADRKNLKKAEMSRQDAEMMLEAYRKKEQMGRILSDQAAKGRAPIVEKDW